MTATWYVGGMGGGGRSDGACEGRREREREREKEERKRGGSYMCMRGEREGRKKRNVEIKGRALFHTYRTGVSCT